MLQSGKHDITAWYDGILTCPNSPRCCVPKTIDNDIAFIDKSFGFESAVGASVGVINCALIEAQDSEQGRV